LAKNTETEDGLDLAAQALADLVQEHKATNEGKSTRTLPAWRGPLRVTLGLRRLPEKRYQDVLRRGIENKLFRLDGESFETATVQPLPPPFRPRPPKPLPEGFTGPSMMDCGHWSFWKQTEGCQACKSKHPPDYVFLNQKFGTPIPANRRRSETNPMGFCCDADGKYLGGLSGDCRFEKHGERCSYHEGMTMYEKKGR